MARKILAGVLGIVLCLFGSALFAGEKVTITYWHIQIGKTAALKDADLARNFMAENPNVRIVMEEVPAAYIEKKTLLAIMSGAMPNVERDYIGRLAAWAHRDVLENLDGTLSADDLKDFLPSILDAFRIDGKLIGYPVYFWLQNYAVNKTILDRAGAVTPESAWTVEEWMEIAKKVKALNDPDIWPTIFFAKSEQGDYWMLMYFQMWGARLWTDKDYTKTTLNSAAGAEALEWMVGLERDGFAPGGTAGRKAVQMIGMWNAGRVALCSSAAKTSTLAYRQSILDGGGVEELQDICIVPTPHVEAAPTPGSYFGPSGVVVFEEKDSAKREAAIKFAQYLSSSEGCRVFATGDFNIPSRRSVELWTDELGFQTAMKIMAEYGVADLGILSPYYLESRHLLYPELQYAFMGLKTAKQALDDFAEGVAELWK